MTAPDSTSGSSPTSPTSPAISRFTGSCHCGAVRLRCELDLTQPTSRCNCSICLKTRLWKTVAVPKAAFELLRGQEALTEYRFASRRVAHFFCRHCGIKLYGHGDAAVFPQEFYVVNVACLDDLPDEFLAGLPVVYQDGRHNQWEAAPAVTAFL